MARLGPLLGLARRLCAERSRRDSYGGSQGLLILLALIAIVRQLANAYLAALVGPRLEPLSGARYLIASTWLLGAYLCSAGCARAYRATAVLLRHERLRSAPLRRGALLLAVAHIALLRPAMLVLAGLLGVSLAAAAAVWGAAAVPAPAILCLLAASLLCSSASYAALALADMGARAVGYLEILALFALVYANPDIRVARGELAVALSNGAAFAPASPAPACLSLAAIPAALAALAVAARLARAYRRRRALRKPPVSQDPLVRLYRADLPVGVFAASFVVEAALVTASSIAPAYLLGLSGALLALRLGWYAAYLVRAEYRIVDWRPAPVVPPRSRLLAYARSAPFHALLCALPASFYLAREIIS